MIAVAFIAVLLVACGDNSSPPDASTITCGSGDTESGGDLYSCADDGQPGLCTTDPHGFVQCFPTCTPQSECDPGSSPYVLALRDRSRVCYCMPGGDQLP